MTEFLKPGDTVPKSGIYRVKHDPDCVLDHVATCIFGKVFPACKGCGDAPEFSLVRCAIDIENHPDFK